MKTNKIIECYENGNKRIEHIYKYEKEGGIKEHLSIEWNEDGTKKYEGEYVDEKLVKGTRFIDYGKADIYHYKDGKPHGYSEYWFDNDTKLIKHWWNEGKPDNWDGGCNRYYEELDEKPIGEDMELRDLNE